MSVVKKLLIMLVLFALVACRERGPGPDYIKFFDQKGFLEHVSANIIVPAYKDLLDRSVELDTALNRLTREPSQEKLAISRQALRDAYIAWQYCAPFEFGPAALTEMAARINLFPLDTARVNLNLSDGNFLLELESNKAARGFPALDYLLNHPVLTDDEILFEANYRLAYKSYLTQATAMITFSAKTAYDSWSPGGGNYLALFTDERALGIDEGSSVAELVNGMSRSIDLMTREAKLAVPLGAGAQADTLAPGSVEAYYGGYSLDLLEANIDAFQLLFTGTPRNGADGLGFDEYLEIKGSKTVDSDQPLSEAISQRFGLVRAAMQAVDLPLSEQIENNQTPVIQLYIQVNRLTDLIKTVMATALRGEIEE